MRRLIELLLAGALLVVAALIFISPHLLLSPGRLTNGHAQLESNCFACHAHLQGSSSKRCEKCHSPSEIGRFTTKGQPINKAMTAHLDQTLQNCNVCHSDHTAVERFDHAVRAGSSREGCVACHKKPTDFLHMNCRDSCIQCHSLTNWQPADFDHNRFFLLDREHRAPCATCHTQTNFRVYSCGGCHQNKAGDRYHYKKQFNHAYFMGIESSQCRICHRQPGDLLHQTRREECSKCHAETQWKPAKS